MWSALRLAKRGRIDLADGTPSPKPAARPRVAIDLDPDSPVPPLPRFPLGGAQIAAPQQPAAASQAPVAAQVQLLGPGWLILVSCDSLPLETGKVAARSMEGGWFSTRGRLKLV
jgi:hypothetical protein